MRTFVALEVPETVNVRLDALVSHWRRESPPARWLPAASRHLTLVFLGTLGEDALAPLDRELATVCAAQPPQALALAGCGAFPGRGRARVLWVGLRRSDALHRLQRELARACRKLGFEIDERPFSPHLTVARCRRPWPSRAIERWRRAAGEALAASDPWGGFAVDRTSLFESLPGPRGVQYRVVRSYPLTRGM